MVPTGTIVGAAWHSRATSIGPTIRKSTGGSGHVERAADTVTCGAGRRRQGGRWRGAPRSAAPLAGSVARRRAPRGVSPHAALPTRGPMRAMSASPGDPRRARPSRPLRLPGAACPARPRLVACATADLRERLARRLTLAPGQSPRGRMAPLRSITWHWWRRLVGAMLVTTSGSARGGGGGRRHDDAPEEAAMIDPTLFGVRASTRRLPLLAVAGRVACPHLHDVDLERCLECPYLARLDRGGRGEIAVLCLASSGSHHVGE
jgi:hypothetical protein